MNLLPIPCPLKISLQPSPPHNLLLRGSEFLGGPDRPNHVGREVVVELDPASLVDLADLAGGFALNLYELTERAVFQEANLEFLGHLLPLDFSLLETRLRDEAAVTGDTQIHANALGHRAPVLGEGCGHRAVSETRRANEICHSRGGSIGIATAKAGEMGCSLGHLHLPALYLLGPA
jgi:hypothetical protein